MKTIEDIIIEELDTKEYENVYFDIIYAIDDKLVSGVKKLVRNNDKNQCIKVATKLINEIHRQFIDEEIDILFK